MFVACVGLFLTHPASADNRWGAGYFPNVPLTTQDGEAIYFYDDVLKGKIVAINLIYTNCEYSCPLETARLAQVQKILGDRVGKDIFFYSISIDPARDTPAQLKAYAEKYHIGPGWTFLTGKKEDIDLISKKMGLWSNPAESKDGHTPNLLIGNEATGQWMRQAATDNPKFLATVIGDWLNNWENAKTGGTTKGATESATIKIADPGQYIFAKQCAPCHTIGGGDKIGPDLLGVTNVRSREWLTQYIAAPEKLRANKDPIALALFTKYREIAMPNLRMGDLDVKAVIDFMKSQTDNFNKGSIVKKTSTEADMASR
jgi:protein SCO1/2